MDVKRDETERTELEVMPPLFLPLTVQQYHQEIRLDSGVVAR